MDNVDIQGPLTLTKYYPFCWIVLYHWILHWICFYAKWHDWGHSFREYRLDSYLVAKWVFNLLLSAGVKYTWSDVTWSGLENKKHQFISEIKYVHSYSWNIDEENREWCWPHVTCGYLDWSQLQLLIINTSGGHLCTALHSTAQYLLYLDIIIVTQSNHFQ